MNLSEAWETANRFRTDIIIIALCMGIGYCFAAKPKADLLPAPKKISLPTEKARLKETAKSDRIVSAPGPYQNIERRNIFSPTGGYELPQVPGTVMPEKPYELVAILRGNEKMAVFRDFTGSLISRKPGEKLADGSEVVKIDDLAVTLKKGDKRKEFKIFQVNSKLAQKVVDMIPPRVPSRRAVPLR
jgi:hypothetical protein